MVVVPEHILHTLHTILYRVKTLLTVLLLCNNLIMKLHMNNKYQQIILIFFFETFDRQLLCFLVVSDFHEVV